MSAISSYANETPATGDKLIGTDATDGGTHNFTVDALKTFYSTSPTLTGTVGIGSAADLGILHVKESDTGGTTDGSGFGDNVVIEGAYSGATMLCGAGEANYIWFGDNLALSGNVAYDHSSDVMSFRAGGSDKLFVSSTAMGFGNSPDLGIVHLKESDTTGSTNGSGFGDNLVIEGTYSGVTMLCGAGEANYIYFGDPAALSGEVQYNHSTDSMNFTVGGASMFSMLSNQFLPVTTEASDLGSAAKEFNNIYSQNAVTVSDERKKENIATIDYSGALIDALNPVQFAYKDTVIPAVAEEVDEEGNVIVEAKPEQIIPHGRPHTGFIAQEVKQAMTDAGLEDWAGYALEDHPDYEDGLHTLRLSEFISVLVAECKSLRSRVSALESA